MFSRRRSAVTSAAIASTTTTALGTMTGSCRPFMRISRSAPSLSTVRWAADTEGVALNAALTTTGDMPSLMPPRIPPELLEPFVTVPSAEIRKGSLSSVPHLPAASKPAPISTPFTAPMDITAWARRASYLSKTVSPRPAGMPFMTHSTTPPAESPFSRSPRRYSCALRDAPLSGIHRGSDRARAMSPFCTSALISPMERV